MKNIIFIFTLLISTSAINAQNKNQAETKTTLQWVMISNLALKGDNGMLILNLPVQATLSLTISKDGEAKMLNTWRSSQSKEFAPGRYDITFWNLRIPLVIEKGKETRILAGVLNSTVKKPWEIWTLAGEKIFSAGSAKMVALPVGKYLLKTSGAEIKTTINDGRVSIFSFTAY
jgi:hypothetical protein